MGIVCYYFMVIFWFYGFIIWTKMGIVIDGNKRDLFRIFATDGRFSEYTNCRLLFHGSNVNERTCFGSVKQNNEANRQKVEQAKERINAKKIAPN